MDINVTLIAQMAAFALLVWFVHRVLMNPMVAMLSQRRKQIADGLAAGERGKHELELASKRAVENLREAKQKAAEIIAQADKRAAQLVEEAKGVAKLEADRMIAGAQASIAQETGRAKEVLRGQVAGLAVAGAEKILRREIDAKAHAGLLDAIKSEL